MSHRSLTASCLFLVVIVVAAAGCSAGHEQEADAGIPSQSVCPSVQTLTYDNFGKQFFDTYCQRCHGSAVTGDARNGAPSDHPFDRVEDIRPLAEHIDELAAGGPAAVNTEMPPSEPRPTEAERKKLGEWLACEAP